MKTEREYVIEYALSLPLTSVDNPFSDDFDTTVLRHSDTGKWFGIIMNISRCKVGLEGEGRIDVMNLKCKPEETFEAREMCEAIVPAYHMNKKHWISLVFNNSISKELMEALIDNSYELTRKKSRINKRNNTKSI